jgi:hypothetical protein
MNNNMKKISTLVPLLGSYSADDCQFLLQEISSDFETIENKEKLIQSGKMHYSEVINQESAPSAEYLELFFEMMSLNKAKLAMDIQKLADVIIGNYPIFGLNADRPIVLMSLARAGTPIGVLLKKALELKGVYAEHYSISIIRDKGIDEVALQYVCDRYADQSLCFIDGWTAKGVITKELHKSVTDFNQKFDTKVPKSLYVVSDIGLKADYYATTEDYAIPSALLNSTISGLLSRTILNEKTMGGFHGCVRYDHLEDNDVSQWFVDEICEEFLCEHDRESLNNVNRLDADDFIKKIQSEFAVSDINRIKPGIAEATRVMLRRVPDVLIVNSMHVKETAHLVKIAQEKGVDIVVDELMPFRATALIKDVMI